MGERLKLIVIEIACIGDIKHLQKLRDSAIYKYMITGITRNIKKNLF